MPNALSLFLVLAQLILSRLWQLLAIFTKKISVHGRDHSTSRLTLLIHDPKVPR